MVTGWPFSAARLRADLVADCQFGQKLEIGAERVDDLGRLRGFLSCHGAFLRGEFLKEDGATPRLRESAPCGVCRESSRRRVDLEG